MAVDVVAVASGGVRLPDLDERIADRPAVLVEHASRDDDALAERLAAGLPGEIVVELADAVRSEHRRRQRVQLLGQRQQGPLRRPQPRRAVVGMEVGRIDVAHAASPFVFSARSAVELALRSAARVSRSVVRDAELPAGRRARLLDLHARVELRQRQLAARAARGSRGR